MIASSLAARLTVDRNGPPRRADTDLIAACLAGAEGAWDRLVDRYGRLVYSIARRYGLTDADCDDVFQSVFVTVFEKLGTLRDQERFSAWLITMTHRQCWRTGRRSGQPVDLAERIEDVGSPSDEQVERWENQTLVRRALEELGGRCELLLKALFTEPGPPSYEAIAEKLGMKIGSIGPTRARCFRKLEVLLLELGIEPPDEEAPQRLQIMIPSSLILSFEFAFDLE